MPDIKYIAKSIHDAIGAILAYIAPVLAPLPSAMAIYHGSGSIIIAVVVESLGFAAVAIALRTYRHNRRSAAAQRFPLWLPVAMFGVYFATTMLIIIAAETLPAWAEWRHGQLPPWEFMASIAPALYPLLTMVGAGVYAISENLDEARSEQVEATNYDRAEHDLAIERQRREMEIELENKRLDAKAKREAARLKLEAKLASQGVPKSSQTGTGRDDSGPSAREPDRGTDRDSDKMGQIETVIGTDPFLSLRQISKITGIPRSTVNRRLKKAGYSLNGQGWARYDGGEQ